MLKKIDKKYLISTVISIVILALSVIFSNKVKLQMELSVKHTEKILSEFVREENLYKKNINLNEKDGINSILELEHSINLTKLNYPSNINSKIEEDDLKLIKEFNSLYFIDNENIDLNNLLKDISFLNRLYELTTKILKTNGTIYLNQRESSDPSIAYNSCMPYSASISLNTLGIETDPDELTHYFKGELKDYNIQYKTIQNYARKNFGNWVNKYINNNKLYQISDILKFGINIHPDVVNSAFIMKFGYKDINWIYDYIQSKNIGVVISTYLPYLVRKNWGITNRKKLKGGHAVYLRDVLKLKIKEKDSIREEILAVIIQDPFGNPNTKYNLLDGHGVLLPIDKFNLCVKTDYTDNRKPYSSDSKIRVLYWDKKYSY